jgi:predicted dehydrogenase
MTKIKVGLLGCGSMGLRLADAVAKGLGEMAAVTDIDAERAKAAGEKFGCDSFTDAGALLGKRDLQAVIVATPGFQHRQDVAAAAKAGKHVFCEKPFALTGEDCREMIGACEKAGVKLMVGQILRYIPAFAKMKEIVDSGELGEPRAVCTTRIHNPGHVAFSHGWRTSKAESGGNLLETSAHEFDYMCYILGGPQSVFAQTAKFIASPRDFEDLCLVTVQFEKGKVGSLRTGLCSAKDLYTVEVLCTEGSGYIENWENVSWGKFGEELQHLSVGELQVEPAIEREIREFLEAIRDDTPVTIPGEDGLRATSLARAAYESAERGEVVRIQ